MDGIIAFACVMVILGFMVYIFKNIIMGMTWLIRHIIDDVYKDLDREKKE